MSREIKFLAWEKRLKEIIPVYDINFETKIINTRSAWRCFDEIELMQFTGHYDKRGTPIYEGDVIKLDGCSALQHVVWTGARMSLASLPHNDDYEDLWTFSAIALEVVGNIYETPYLLEATKNVHDLDTISYRR